MHQFVGRLLVFTCGGEQWCNNYYSSPLSCGCYRASFGLGIIIRAQAALFPSCLCALSLLALLLQSDVCLMQHKTNVPLERSVRLGECLQISLHCYIIPALVFWGNVVNYSYGVTQFGRIYMININYPIIFCCCNWDMKRKQSLKSKNLISKLLFKSMAVWLNYL